MRVGYTSWVCIMLLGLLILCIGSVQADDADILDQYAPVYQYTESECCFPVDVEYFMTNSDLYEYSDDGAFIRETNPTSESIGNMRGSILDNGIILDYQSKLPGLGYTVYGKVMSEGNATIAQYWTFYAFNKGSLNVHEGDWEMVQVVISGNTSIEVMFSQHNSGMRATWEQVDKEGDHVVVYVAEGTHANYARSCSGRFGVASDVVGDSGRRISNGENGGYTIELLSSQGWLDFSGHWGYYGGPEDELRGKTGPGGPKFRESGEMWGSAFLWGQGLASRRICRRR